MRILIGVLAACLIGVVTGGAQESFIPTIPVSQPSISAYNIDFIHLNRRQGTIEAQVYDNTGRLYYKAYTAATSPTGLSLLIALNKANLSTAGNSLESRVLKQLQTDGVLPAGTVTGTPQ